MSAFNLDKHLADDSPEPVVTIIPPEPQDTPHPPAEENPPDNIIDGLPGPLDRPAIPRVNNKPADTSANFRTNHKNLCFITRQLSTLLAAGMPVVPALTALQEQFRNLPEAEMLQEIIEQVNSGSSLADALKKYPLVFSELFINMVYAGETSGTLENVLSRLADILDKRRHLNSKIRSALAYPALMILTAIGVVGFLLTFVIPGIARIFTEMHRALPWPTVLLISFSRFLRSNVIIFLAVLCLAVLGLIFWRRSPKGKLTWDRCKLKLPLVGPVLLKTETIRLARTLGIMLTSGIPILDALNIAQGIIRNSFIAGHLEHIGESVRRGHTLAQAIRQTALFPPIFYHRIAIGEMSGTIENQLLDIADDYDRELDMMIRSLLSLLEPLILLVMGAVIGFIVLAILLPIFDINQML